MERLGWDHLYKGNSFGQLKALVQHCETNGRSCRYHYAAFKYLNHL
jgi:hypothetical protein